MRARRWAATLVATLALVAALAAAKSPARGPAWQATFPAGEGRAIAERSCLICHSAMLVRQQAKDSTGWEKTLALMEKWGATLTPAEHDTLRRWLLVTQGPRPR